MSRRGALSSGGEWIATDEAPRRFAAVQQVLGLLLMAFSVTLLPPIGVSLWYADGAVQAFLTGLWITLATGAAVWWPVRYVRADLKIRDGFLVTVLFWAVLSAFGAIPLLVTDAGWHSYVDALFEAVSGLTTTGATVIASGLDTMPRSLLYYRAQLHWLGGMGVIVLAVALLPMLGIGGMQLFRAETPGPIKDNKLTPRITQTARALWFVYVAMTVACIAVYWLLGMSPFDAVCHAFATLATGGFSTHDASIAFFHNPALEWAVALFMALATVNFAVHFTAFRERSLAVYLRDAEVRAFALTVLGFSVLVTVPLVAYQVLPGTGDAIRAGVFQVISYGSTSGFITMDPSHWPLYTPLMLMLTGFMVGCAGSTAGGVKVVRLMLFVKQALREMHRLIHPAAVLPIKLEGRVIEDTVVYAIGGFFSVYIGATIVLTFVMMTTGLDAVTAFSAVAACINNMGPGLNQLNASMASVTDFGKCVLIFSMLLGRLEVFTLLIIFTPTFWRR
ncbi:MAG TPA: TrkH family potassium uptake protein [Solimonas sp.]|nr:TrkH family potassium uptake protein [Solimonas sp.]